MSLQLSVLGQRPPVVATLFLSHFRVPLSRNVARDSSHFDRHQQDRGRLAGARRSVTLDLAVRVSVLSAVYETISEQLCRRAAVVAERNENKWFTGPRRRLMSGIMGRLVGSPPPSPPTMLTHPLPSDLPALVARRCTRVHRARTSSSIRSVADTRCGHRPARLRKETS